MLKLSSFGQNLEIAGGQVTYSHIQDQNYLIDIDLIRACESGSYPSQISILFNTSCGNDTLIANLKSIKSITPTCGYENLFLQGACANPNSKSKFGFEIIKYETRIDLLNYTQWGISTCCDLSISILDSLSWYNRINSGQAGELAYLESNLSLCHLKAKNQISNSPESQNYLKISPLNQPYVFNVFAIDNKDYDSIAISLIKPLKSINLPATYGAGYSERSPIRNSLMSFDSINGDAIFTATEKDKIGIFSMLYTEYRKDAQGKYQSIGSVVNTIPILSYEALNNNYPKLFGPYHFQVCEGEKICFDIRSKDDPIILPPPASSPEPDTTYLRWNKSIPGATFKIKNPSERERIAQFCWEPRLGQASNLPYAFIVSAQDDNCLDVGKVHKTFSVTVRNNPKVDRWITIENGNVLVIRLKKLYAENSSNSHLLSVFHLDSSTFVYAGQMATNPWNDSILEFRMPVSQKGKIRIQINFSNGYCNSVISDTLSIDAPTSKISHSLNSTKLYYTAQKLVYSGIPEGSEIKVYTLEGKLMRTLGSLHGSGEGDLSNLAQGMYIAILTSKDQVERILRFYHSHTHSD